MSPRILITILALILGLNPSTLAWAQSPLEPCLTATESFIELEQALGDSQSVIDSTASRLPLPVAGFPLNNSDAYVGSNGYVDIVSLVTLSQSGISRDLSGPMTELLFNPIDHLQLNIATGGFVADRTNGVNTAGVANSAVGAKYTMDLAPEKGLTAAIAVQEAFNTGKRAVDAKLVSAGPLKSVSLYVSKSVGNNDTLSFDLTETRGPAGTGELSYGPVLAHQFSDKLTAFAELVGRRSRSGDSVLTPALGVSYQLSEHYSVGIGISRSIKASGDTYAPGTAIMVGVSWNN